MSPNATISCLALPGYHQSLLGNQGAILGSPLGNHLPIKFGKPWIVNNKFFIADLDKSQSSKKKIKFSSFF